MKYLWWSAMWLVIIVPFIVNAQEVLFDDEFGGTQIDTSKWIDYWGAMGVADGKMVLDPGQSPATDEVFMFRSADNFPFSSEDIRIEYQYEGGDIGSTTENGLHILAIGVTPEKTPIEKFALPSTGETDGYEFLYWYLGYRWTMAEPTWFNELNGDELASYEVQSPLFWRDGEGRVVDYYLNDCSSWNTTPYVQCFPNQEGDTYQIHVYNGIYGIVMENGVTYNTFSGYGPRFTGGVGWRLLSGTGSDACLDDVKVYKVNDDGSKEMIFEDDFEDYDNEQWVDERGKWELSAMNADGSYPGDTIADIYELNGNKVLELSNALSSKETWIMTSPDIEIPWKGNHIVFEYKMIQKNGTSYSHMPLIDTHAYSTDLIGPFCVTINSSGNKNAMRFYKGRWRTSSPTPGEMAVEITQNGTRIDQYWGDVWCDGFNFTDRYSYTDGSLQAKAYQIKDGGIGWVKRWSYEKTYKYSFDYFRVIKMGDTRAKNWMVY